MVILSDIIVGLAKRIESFVKTLQFYAGNFNYCCPIKIGQQ